jgi:hypothetical protein
METGFNGAVDMAEDYGNRPIDIISIWAVLFLILPLLALVLLCGFVGSMRSRKPSAENSERTTEATFRLLTLPSSLIES